MKKLFLLAAISLALFTACSSDKKDETTDKKMEDSKMTGDKMDDNKKSAAQEKEERNKKVAMASIEGVNAHDVNRVLKDATEDGSDYG
ncbi:MAG TPA: hypothetical protein VKB95_05440, partial [Chitinophagaceae bacterium]|nr:hypothetical protein [Chitinophagaceae bacterium]